MGRDGAEDRAIAAMRAHIETTRNSLRHGADHPSRNALHPAPTAPHPRSPPHPASVIVFTLPTFRPRNRGQTTTDFGRNVCKVEMIIREFGPSSG